MLANGIALISQYSNFLNKHNLINNSSAIIMIDISTISSSHIYGFTLTYSSFFNIRTRINFKVHSVLINYKNDRKINDPVWIKT